MKKIREFWVSLTIQYQYWKLNRQHKRKLKELRKKDPHIYD